MPINKVVYGTNELINLTNDTVTAETLVEGTTAHDKSGAIINGTNPYEKVATDLKINTEANLISQIQTALNGKICCGAILTMTQTEYDSLETKDENTLYCIVEVAT